MQIHFRVMQSQETKPVLLVSGADLSSALAPFSRAYLDFNPQAKQRRRHDGQLVLSNGWICLDYDDRGFLVGLEFVEGDPFGEVISYLQPRNPLQTPDKTD